MNKFITRVRSALSGLLVPAISIVLTLIVASAILLLLGKNPVEDVYKRQPQTRCYNPAFDVTPHELVDAIVTDRGICRAPYTESLKALFE